MDTTLHPEVPARAALFSLVSLAVPVLGTILLPGIATEFEILLWVLALVPAFLLAYYRGWRGVATALAAGMAVLSVTQVVTVIYGQQVQNWPFFLGVITLYIVIALGIGSLSEILHRERSRAEALAFTDELTGIGNRRAVRRHVRREFAAAGRGRTLTVVLLDVDAFGAYNASEGREAGDDVLRAVARIIDGETRAMNMAGRWGGDEFMAVLSGGDTEGAVVFVNRIRRAVAAVRRGPTPFTLSIGIAAYDEDMKAVEELITAAERALTRAKWTGGNGVSVFSADPNGTASGRDRLMRVREHLQRAEASDSDRGDAADADSPEARSMT